MFRKTKNQTPFRDHLSRLHPFIKLILFIPLFLAVLLITGLIFNVLTRTLGIPPRNELVNELSLLSGITASIALSHRWLKTISLAASGLKSSRFAAGDFAKGFGYGAALLGIFFLIMLAFGWLKIRGFAWTARGGGVIATDMMTALIFTLTVGIVEELLFRGFLFQMLEQFIPIRPAAVASSFIFAVLHLINPGTGGWFNGLIIASHTLAGMILVLLFLRRRTLWIAIGMHFAWNFFEYYLLGLTGIAKDKAVFLITEITGPMIFAGNPKTAFGPETTVEGIAILLILTIILYPRFNEQET